MEGKRRVVTCLNCNELKEHAAYGLCPACYQREKRAADQPFVDAHNPGITKDHKRILAGFSKLIAGLGDIGVSHDKALRIRRIIAPDLRPVQHLLSPPPETSVEEDRDDASEQ